MKHRCATTVPQRRRCARARCGQMGLTELVAALVLCLFYAKTVDEPRRLDAQLHSIRGALAALDAELADAANVALRPIEDDGGPDVRYWNESLVDAWIGETWLDAPWLVSEFYFYRRVLEAIRYFGDGPGAGKDPFQRDKDAGLAACAEATKALAPKLNAFANGDGDDDAALATMRLFVLVSLWGNRMDLSIWPAAGATASGASGEAASSTRAARAFDEALRAGEECLLWDDSAAAAIDTSSTV